LKTAIYAGSFDPITAGHVFVINEALAIFDKLYIAIGTNPGKKTTFNASERVQMIKNAFPNEPRIEVVSFENQFLVNFCKNNNIDVMVRGIRNVADLEYETQILYINEKINKNIRSVYLIPPTELAGVSSSMVKGMIGFPEWQFAVEGLVPKANISILMAKHYGEPLVNFIKQSDLGVGWLIEEEIKLYNASGRYYHTTQHILEMMKSLSENCWEISIMDWRRRPLYYAALYHDIIYDPLAKDNEEKSSQFFHEVVKSHNLHLTPKDIDLVSSLIMATKNHDSGDKLHQLFIDADLSILAATSDRFNEYERQIRAEYSMAPEQVYNKGRAEFIDEMLARPKIFLTENYARYEDRARANLTKLVERLRTQS
jgi:pantetheine-phosphate adenylyltransferase